MTNSETVSPLSNLSLAVLAKMSPIVETDPARLHAMADALLHSADLYAARTVFVTADGEALPNRWTAGSNCRTTA